MALTLVRASTLRGATLKASPASRSSRVLVAPVRASNEKEGEIHFAGKTYTQAEWEQAKANGTLSTPEPVPVSVDASAPAAGAAAAAAVPSFGQLMSFSGPAPELINGRLAMLGVVAALAAEFSSGESVWRQIADEPTGIVAVFGLIIAASFAPLLNNAKPESESFGPFNAAAERLNGRAAMIGIAALLVIEWFKGAALF